MKSAKEYRDYLKSKGCFYTGDKLAKTLRSYLPDNVDEVYDPTCGSGNLLAVFGDDVAKYGQELDGQTAYECAKRLTNATIYDGDTLANDAFKGRKFKYILANPPFSVAWNPDKQDERFKVAPCVAPKSKADWAFILHCYHHLADNGKAVVLCFPGIAYRGNAEWWIRQWMVEKRCIERIVYFEGKYFEDTTISTIALVIDKGGNHESIIFEDKVREKEVTATIEDIINQNYDLSVNRYFKDEVKREEIDIDALNKQILDSAIKTLEKEYKLFELLDGLDGTKNKKSLVDCVEKWLSEKRQGIQRLF